ncbi:hypothetical protein FJTKL_10347 [Diaporthe vaccinii]|uniref:Uncharacterized protein n=1 Tax=Diaporthe vaccinii TaxID=105482 RepID=A0ABR4EJU6_9PEZI
MCTSPSSSDGRAHTHISLTYSLRARRMFDQALRFVSSFRLSHPRCGAQTRPGADYARSSINNTNDRQKIVFRKYLRPEQIRKR